MGGVGEHHEEGVGLRKVDLTAIVRAPMLLTALYIRHVLCAPRPPKQAAAAPAASKTALAAR